MFKSILVTIDVEHDTSWSRALPTAARLARANGADLHVVYVVPPYESSLVGGFFPKDHEETVMKVARDRLAQVASDADLAGVKPTLHVAHGTVYEEVLRAADTLAADLIVLHAHRPELSDYLLGPNAARVVRHAKQSVFVIRN